MIFVKSSIDMGGYDSNGNRYIIIDIEADTESDLPSVDYFISAGCIIGMSSTAHTIDTNAVYQMTSAGTWELKDNGTAAYTKAQTDALLLQKQNVLTFDAAPVANSTNPVYSGGVYSAIANFITLDSVFGLAVRLPDTGIDANDYTTAGVFRMQTGSGAGLSSNIPMNTAAFRLIVEYINNVTRVRQTFIPLADPAYYFIRILSGNGWQGWRKFEGTTI